VVEERTLVVGIEIGPVSALEEQLQFQETAEASQLATWPGWNKNKYSIIISVILCLRPCPQVLSSFTFIATYLTFDLSEEKLRSVQRPSMRL